MKPPIFIVGTGRSGTTIFFKMLKNHPNVAWLSSLNKRYREKRYLNRFAYRALNYPFLGKILQKRVYPSEAYSYWDRLFPGFSSPCRDLLGDDVTIGKGNKLARGIKIWSGKTIQPDTVSF